MSSTRRRRSFHFAFVFAVLLASSAHAAPAATALLYERTLMSEANARCHLFTAEIAPALAASTVQARGAAVRAGTAPDVIAGVQARALAKADATPCTSRDLAIAAERVRTAFHDYAQLLRMTFPGQFADWRADRLEAAPRRGAAWRLVQLAPAGVQPTLVGLSLGLPGATDAEVLTVASGRPQALAASSARLIMRDPAKDAQPYADPRRRDLAARVPPRGRDQVFLASARLPAPRSLLPQATPTGAVFTFRPEAIEAMAALDPRDAVMVELVYATPQAGRRGEERTEAAWIEVGDFAAARAFLASGAPRTARSR